MSSDGKPVCYFCSDVLSKLRNEQSIFSDNWKLRSLLLAVAS